MTRQRPLHSLILYFLLLYYTPCSALSINRNDILTRRQCSGFLSSLLVPPILSGDASSVRAAPLTPVGPYLSSEYYDPVVTAPGAGRFFFPTLTPPFRNRATYRHGLGRDAWAFEQLLTFANVTASIRCNVLKLQSTGGLWVHSPQWPTGEFCQLLDDLKLPVEHIVLPCNAFEHGAPMKAFVKRYPTAAVWISPGQYGPFGSCGHSLQQPVKMGYRVDGILGDTTPPWADEFDIAALFVDIPQNAGPVSEVAFCHRPTKTLVATDAVVYIPEEAPDIFTTYFDEQIVRDDATFWPRSVLQAVFLPLRIDDEGAYPGYNALKGRLIRAPILRAFADARAPRQVQEWISTISKWDFDRIITSHFASPVAATPNDFAAAYGYLPNGSLEGLPPIACQDWQLLESLNKAIAENRLGAPAVYDFQRGCIP